MKINFRMQASYRDNGAKGALLDEYEKAIKELQSLISSIPDDNLKLVVDSQTSNSDCVSIQSVLTHTVRAGILYVQEIRQSLGEEVVFCKREYYDSVGEYVHALDNMFKMNVQLFNDYPKLSLEENDASKKIKVAWGQIYDVEQLYEHAIVHVLRHRRQIERFLLKLGG